MSFKSKIIETIFGEMSGEKYAAIILFVLLFGFIFYVFWVESNYEFRCVGESKVEKILELKYRDADILLENGMIVEVSQARLEVGDNYCYKWKEFKIED